MMRIVLKLLKDWALPVAMITGTLTYSWISQLSFLLPYMVFAMLLLSFTKLSPREIRVKPEHLVLLVIQVVGSVAVYVLLRGCHPLLAQGALICILVPTATSAAVVTGMLGGNVAFLTTYLIVSNVVVAVFAPLLFSFIGFDESLTFWQSFLFICRQVGPVLVLPLALAWFLRYGFPAVHSKIANIRGASFYIWAAGLTIVTGNTVRFLVEQENPDYRLEIFLALLSLVICVGQFLLGRSIGRRYNDPVSSGQGLGQKNTILAIWMAQSYLNPVCSVAPAAYILWQNLINSYQLWVYGKKQGKTNV